MAVDFQLRNLSVDLKIFNLFAVREFDVKKYECLFAPLNIANTFVWCVGALKVRVA
jgi:hypothetical protein